MKNKVITIWKDGTYRIQEELDDYYCQQDKDWLLSIFIEKEGLNFKEGLWEK